MLNTANLFIVYIVVIGPQSTRQWFPANRHNKVGKIQPFIDRVKRDRERFKKFKYVIIGTARQNVMNEAQK